MRNLHDRAGVDAAMMRSGAHCTSSGVEFRVWAPAVRHIELVVESGERRQLPLQADADGCHATHVEGIGPGTLYRYQLDGKGPYPDPRSRYQPQGPHGPSMVVDLDSYPWNDAGWHGLTLQGQVIYELHIGTFTPEGTFDAAALKLPHLRDLGVTAVEIMPVAECPGRWNWGYDGVCLYAPSHHYGDAAALQRFVDEAHRVGLGVVLDVVYNHLGPDGNYLKCYSPEYFTDRYSTEWGEALNFDGEYSGPVREFIIDNACDWIRYYHIDGLRLDATQSIFDSSERHILAELTARVRAAGGTRGVMVVAENEPQHARHLLPETQGGFGLDAMWNDDFHHAAYVAATGRRHAYYHDYSGRAQELVSATKYGFLFQGQYYPWQQQRRGQPLGTAAQTCIHFLQNHDQVANSLNGARLHQQTSAARCRALTALLLLGPQTPMLFMGQEFAASSPFLFFADHYPDLKDRVAEGRRDFLSQFPGAADWNSVPYLRDPADPATFAACRLDWSDVVRNASVVQLHHDLLKLRREDPVISTQDTTRLDGATLGEFAFVLRWLDPLYGDRLLLVNPGPEIPPGSFAEPLLAPPFGAVWSLIWSSEHPRYGGLGVEHPDSAAGWYCPAETAVLLHASAAEISS